MAGFDTAELLPYYLDETEEQVVTLNDALLRLERDPAEAQALQEAFRIAHTIKGSSRLMGFEQVANLTHHLESYFDQLRGGTRSLDRPALDLCFRCLDALRDFHRELRSAGQGALDLSDVVHAITSYVEGKSIPQPIAAAPAPSPPSVRRMFWAPRS